MHQDIRKGTLLVISDTAMYGESGKGVAFEPVVRELESLQQYFKKIIWLGSEDRYKKSSLSMPSAANMQLIIMPATTYRRFNALKNFLNYPVFLYYILKYLPGSTHVHTRAPSHPAILGMLISFLDRKRIYWHKYAGDWNNNEAPFTYRFQRKLLKALRYNNIRVTVNGNWENPPHIHAFENPCIFEHERNIAVSKAMHKHFEGNLSLLFVGGLNTNKGIMELLDALRNHIVPQNISDAYIIGNGPLDEQVKERAAGITNVRIHVLGQVDRKVIDEYYETCHFLVLPSRSEGFPKVIAEAAAYGCIPVVTDISSLSQYINSGENGFLLANNNPATIAETLNAIVQAGDLKEISRKATALSEQFTFEHFVKHIRKDIFND